MAFYATYAVTFIFCQFHSMYVCVCLCVCVFVRLTNGLFFPAAIFTLCSALTSGHLYMDMYAHTPTHTDTDMCRERRPLRAFLPSFLPAHTFLLLDQFVLSQCQSLCLCLPIKRNPLPTFQLSANSASSSSSSGAADAARGPGRGRVAMWACRRDTLLI